MMSTSSARGLAVAAGVTAAGTRSVATIMEGDAPRLRVIFAGFGVAVFLSALAGVRPDIAGGLAALVIVTSLFTNAGPILTALGNLTS
jgi:hypothetical protein